MKFTASTNNHKFQPVEADSGPEAVRTFADRLARKMYGKRGTVGNIRQDSWNEAETSSTWEVFVGYPNDGGVTGRNVWLYLEHAPTNQETPTDAE
jgi:hypothetical protein